MKKIDYRPDVQFYDHGMISISRDQAQAILGEPHFIEKDSMKTAGGEEDHWLFQCSDTLFVLFKMRVPYDRLSLYFTVEEPFDFSKVIPENLLEYEVEAYDVSYRIP